MMSKQVEEYLNEVDYSIPKDYVPTDFALSYVNFIKLVNGSDGEENKTPIVHYRMLDTVTKTNRSANMCHRGVSKTTLFGEYLILYLAVYGELPIVGKVDLGLYVSDSIENGVKNMRKNLEYRWENSEFLQTFVPDIKFTDIRWEFRNLDNKRLIVKGYGAKTGVRGAKELGKRPQLAILDDLISDEDARSATVINSIEDTVYKAVEHALHPTSNMMIWSGTPFNQNDPLYKAVNSGTWSVNVFPVCEQFPCKPEEFKGSWPDRFPYKYVKSKYEDALKRGRIQDFNQELMLRIVSEDDRLVKESDIKWYSRNDLIKQSGFYNWYITTDFATSTKQSGDFSGVAVWAYNSNKDWFLVDGYLERTRMDTNVDRLFKYSTRYKPQLVGVEVNGQQGGFIPWIQREMMTKNVWFTLASHGNNNEPGLRSSTDKFARFNTVLPWFSAGKIHFPEELRDTPFIQEMLNELYLVTNSGIKSKHDDGIDLCSQLSLLKVWEPSSESESVDCREEKQNNGGPIWDDDDESYSEDIGYNSYIV